MNPAQQRLPFRLAVRLFDVGKRPGLRGEDKQKLTNMLRFGSVEVP
jgi:hypothetical protein